MSELKEVYAYQSDEIESLFGNANGNSYYLKSEADKVIAHHKYKRCLAMAMWCEEAYNRECGLNPEEMTNKEFYKQQTEFWYRWNSKWLKIAEKFKEAK